MLDFSNQHISINILNPFSSMVTGVYGSTDYRLRKNLCDYLTSTSTTVIPWCVIRDFNSILLASEKMSLRPLSTISVKDFNDMVLITGLKDIAFRGNGFTWANDRQGQAFVAARLDRAYSNADWLSNFEDPIVNHLPRLCSVHSPILLSHRIYSPQKKHPFPI